MGINRNHHNHHENFLKLDNYQFRGPPGPGLTRPPPAISMSITLPRRRSSSVACRWDTTSSASRSKMMMTSSAY